MKPLLPSQTSIINPGPRQRQVSPLSIDSTESSSFFAHYQAITPTESPYSATSARYPLQHSPPRSQHQSSSTDNSSSQRGSNRSPSGSHNGHISSASSVALSSNGLDSPVGSESGRAFTARQEETLIAHYNVLKTFLAPELARDSGARTARAKDKLLRLSATQYIELSTDVYDEFRRREDDRKRRGQGVPRHLPPRNDFHPKRNQARQKLSHLSPDRFKQLATDAFFELERRIPRLAGQDIDRNASPAGSNYNLHVGPVRAGTPSSLRGPPSPMPPGAYRGPGPGYGPGPAMHNRPSPNGYRSASNDFGRPLPQSFQNSIVPNKGTMIEEDNFHNHRELLRVNTHLTSNSSDASPMSAQSHDPRAEQLVDLQTRLNALEDQLQAKSASLEQAEATKRDLEQRTNAERQGWHDTRKDLEERLANEQQANHDSAQQRSKMREEHLESQAEMRDHMETSMSELQSHIDTLTKQNETLRTPDPTAIAASTTEWRDRCQDLQERLVEQERVTEQVRRDASQFLQEMRSMTEQTIAGSEHDEQYQTRISELEKEVQTWKERYAKTKTLLRTMKAPSVGLSLHIGQTARVVRPEFLSPNGIVNDVEMTNFQMSIDELLQTARNGAPDATLTKMKAVITHVKHMTSVGDKSGTSNVTTGLLSPASSPNPQLSDTDGSNVTALRVKVSRAANSLITTTRTFVTGKGLAPVSLVDAAAANLTAAVIDYVKTVGIKTTPATELQMDAVVEHDVSSPPLAQISNGVIGADSPTAFPPGVRGHGGWASRLKGSFDSTYSNENGFGTLNHEHFEDDDDVSTEYR